MFILIVLIVRDLHFIRYFVDVKIIRSESYYADLRVAEDSKTFYLSNPLLDFLRVLQYCPRCLNITLNPMVDQGSP